MAPPSDRGEHPGHDVLEQAAEWYALLISHEATAEDRRRWAQWLEDSPLHQQAWGRVERISQRVLAPLRESPDPRRTSDNLHAATRRMQQRRSWLAGVTALAGTGLAAWMGWRSEPLRQWASTWRADWQTSIGEIREVALSDGSHVWMNTDSAFNLDFRADLRRLELVRGEVSVRTGHQMGDARPFVVDSREGRLRALGTQFTVRQEEGRTLVAVFEGAVEIRTAASRATVVVPAGQQTWFSALATEALRPADLARQAWSHQQLLAMDLPLEEVVAELGRYTHMHIGVAPAVAQRRVFGSFPLTDVEGTLDLLAAATQLRVRRTLPWWVTLEPAGPPSASSH